MKIKQYFELEKQPKHGLMALEWVVLIYMALTLLVVFFCRTKLQSPDAMVEGRLRIAAVTVGMWVVYRLVPCKATRFLRVLVQMVMLGWWYDDTYRINCLFPNLDHVVASWEQAVFGCQPALLFAEKVPQAVVSEVLDFAYVSYFPIIAAVSIYYFFCRYREFERCCFVIIASFFTFYMFFNIFPVTGPMYYFQAIGPDNAMKGIFPVLGDYFRTHTELMPAPGYTDGIGYALIQTLHEAERPTGAFPSSHVGIATVVMLLAARSRSRGLFFSLLPFAVLIVFATVYIRAHYAIDAIVGLLVGVLLYCFWSWVATKAKITSEPNKKSKSRK